LNKSIEEFKSAFLTDSEDEKNKFKFNSLPCPFLIDNKCSNYTHRPGYCKSFLHLDKEYFSSRLMGVIESYSISPIVFNVYERLKKILWGRGWRKNVKNI
jgi:Fe-S-cluster containining protein